MTEGRGSLRLGVVIPTLNEAGVLPRLLERLTAARPEDRADDLRVVDGGSRDGTPALAESLGARVVSVQPASRGAQLARGARSVDGDVLVFLHADCLPETGALARVRAAFERPDVRAACFRQRIDAAGWFYRSVERVAAVRARRFGEVLGDSGLCLRRSIYEAVGGFADLPLFEDIDLSRRLRAHAKVEVLDDARLRVNARRWRFEGRWRRTGRNQLMRTAFALGIPASRLVRYYRPDRWTS